MSPSVTTQPLDDLQKLNERIAVLLDQCESGSESALEELYKLSSAQLYGALIRILRIEAVAEEALQDTFINIWQNAGKFKPDSGTPMGWLYSIARHRALDILRQRRSRENLESADTSGLIEATPDLSKPAHEMSEDAALLIECLETLPEGPKYCITKAYCEGYSNQELAQLCDKPGNTIKSWLRRGLLSLKECLDGHT